MQKTLSRDGTPIAFDRTGSGPALVLVDGALCYRSQGPSGSMASQLAKYFTVYTYDRRGRGDSGNGPSYAIERELEDLEALLREAGGAAFVYGVSSGAALALEAGHRGLPITRLVLYEAPVGFVQSPLIQDGGYLPGCRLRCCRALDCSAISTSPSAIRRRTGTC